MNEIFRQIHTESRKQPAPDARARRDSLARLADAIHKHQESLISAVSADFGHRARQDTILGDLFPTLSAIKHLSSHLSGWMKPEKRSVALHFKPGRAWIEFQPLGVVGVMSPWNYPIGLALTPLATALAAGNRVMLKPSEFTPQTSALLAAMLSEIFPQDQVAVVTGGAEAGSAFASLPFDLICFTGSTGVGKVVMKAASENLVPVILELGGKSPAIVDAGYPLEHAARSIAHGKLANAGQTCIAPDYALVPEQQGEAFAALVLEEVNQLYPLWATNDDYGAIISDRHHERLTRLVEDARSRGATVVEAPRTLDSVVAGRPAKAEGETPGGPPDNQIRGGASNSGIGKSRTGSSGRNAAAAIGSRKFPPTILRDVTREMAVMQEEIFGPIFPIVTYRTIDEAIAYVNSNPRPLALYLYSHNDAHQQQVLSRTTSGGVTINDTMLHFLNDSLPFGGIGSSGMGCYHGVDGFRNFSHRKAVFHQSRLNFADLLRPPFGQKFDRVIRVLLGR